jgi:hypothetical protein
LGGDFFRFPKFMLGVPPCWRAFFLLLRQKKEAKEKATPRSAPLRGSLRYSTNRAACLNSPAAQTRQADCPRPACVAQRLAWGPKGVSEPDSVEKIECCGQPEKKPKNENHKFSTDAFPGPLRGAEQRRLARIKGEHCLRAKPELRSALNDAKHREEVLLGCPRVSRVAQGTGVAGTDPGVAFSLATFFWPRKRKYARPQGGTPSQLTKTTTKNQ